jgi:hypothetical protein
LVIIFSSTENILTTQTNRSKSFWVLVPVFGSILFIILYIIAALLYPGGSETDKTAIGYSWTNNYWCNLLHDDAINGERNTAKPVAIAGMFILGLALSVFWILFPAETQLKIYHRLLIQIAGTVGMITSFLLLTKIDHDIAINTSSAFGLIAMLGTMIALYQLKWKVLFAFGIFDLLLIALNNYLYHTEQMTYLPLVQKFSFLSFLVWFCLIDLKLYRR